MYFVYEHWRPDTGACFYVGKGKRWRPWEMTNRNRWHQHVVAKLASAGLKVEVRIIASGLSNNTAIALEKERIALYGHGILVNLTNGGEGVAGRQVSEETRKKLRQAGIGRKCSEETKRKLSLLNTGRKIPYRKRVPHSNSGRFTKGHAAHNKGKPPDAATRGKISTSLRGNVPWNKGLSIKDGPNGATRLTTQISGD